jgi:hypothetical protein
MLLTSAATAAAAARRFFAALRSFGGVAGWDGPGSPVAESDESINYQIVDRPTQGHK